MKIAVIADVHGNLEALNAVIADLKKLSPDSVISLGDVVGYGADPQKCCELTAGIAHVNIKGNHDAAVTNIIDVQYFNKDARAAIEWTKSRLSAESVLWLHNAPYTFKEDELLFCHGSPVNPKGFDYVATLDAVEAVFNKFKGKFRIYFVGHSHRRFVASKKLNGHDTAVVYLSDIIKLEKDRQYLISVGSVGQPRDGNNTASYGILDTSKWIYSVKKLNYDIKKAGKKIIQAGLPQWLAYRLTIGV